MKGPLIEVTDRSCKWTNGPARCNETWWWNDNVSNSVSKNWKLWKDWKQRNTSKEKYLEAKNKARRNVYHRNAAG